MGQWGKGQSAGQQLLPPTRKKLQVVRFDDYGKQSGETAPGAKLSDHDVELMRVMYEEFPPGHPQHVGFTRLAKVFECSRVLVRGICHYRRRVKGL